MIKFLGIENCMLFLNQNFGVFWFFGETLSRRSRLSRTSRGKGSLSTNSTTPDRLRQRTRTEGEDFPVVWFQHRQKENHLQKVPNRVLVYTPKKAHHSRSFVTGESVFAQQILAKKMLLLARPACMSTQWQYKLKKLSLLGHLFSILQTSVAPKSGRDMLVTYAPGSGYSPATFEAIRLYPLPKLALPRPKKRKRRRKNAVSVVYFFSKISGQNRVFLTFFKSCVTPILTQANNKRSYPTNSTTPDQLW